METKPARKFKLMFYLLVLLGTAIFMGLLVREGVADVFKLMAAGVWCLVAVVVYHVIPLALESEGWRTLFSKGERPRRGTIFWMRWVGESINNLVPAAQVGGDIVRMRLAALMGIPGPSAAASVLVNITMNVFAQIVFTLMGFVMLINATRRTSLEKPALFGVAVSAFAIGGFYIVQRFGGIRWMAAMIARMAGPEWGALVRNVEELDRRLQAYYSRTWSVIACGLWGFASWTAGAVEVWIALYALGAGGSFGHALIIESVSQGFRTAVFFIPGALGVQEGGYVFVCSLLGIPGQTAMALALIRRVRELAVGVPGIVAWQVFEGKQLRQGETATGGSGGAARSAFPDVARETGVGARLGHEYSDRAE